MDKQECIERQLESALLEGRWGVFERLPSERGLAEAFGVNRATVRAALRALGGRGILETRRGSGTVVRALPAMRAMPPGRSRIISPRSASSCRLWWPHPCPPCPRP